MASKFVLRLSAEAKAEAFDKALLEEAKDRYERDRYKVTEEYEFAKWLVARGFKPRDFCYHGGAHLSCMRGNYTNHRISDEEVASIQALAAQDEVKFIFNDEEVSVRINFTF